MALQNRKTFETRYKQYVSLKEKTDKFYYIKNNFCLKSAHKQEEKIRYNLKKENFNFI
jgi:hypothetical protein